jgi:hypothetical protein
MAPSPGGKPVLDQQKAGLLSLLNQELILFGSIS